MVRESKWSRPDFVWVIVEGAAWAVPIVIGSLKPAAKAVNQSISATTIDAEPRVRPLTRTLSANTDA